MRTRITGPRDAAPLGPLDPRDHGWREDLADIALVDRIAVPNYVVPAIMRVAVPAVPLLGGQEQTATAVSELLHGEEFAVLDQFDGVAWGYGRHDGYVGHVPLAALRADDGVMANAMVGPGDALLFAGPTLKAPVRGTLPMASRLAVADADGGFAVVAAGPFDGLFIDRRHLLPAGGDPALDWVAVAERFLGSPYRWGGRTRAGVDCSGLVQVARMVAGRPTRRDSDMQAADAGTAVAATDIGRGTIACWPGHIGVMLDGVRLLHANAHGMACTMEPLADVVARAGAVPRFHKPD